MERKAPTTRKPRAAVKKAKVEEDPTQTVSKYRKAADPPAEKRVRFEDENHEDDHEEEDRRMDSNFVLVVGAPKRGKSHWIRWYIVDGMRKKKWDQIVVMSPTKSSDPRFSDWGFLDQDYVWGDTTTYDECLNKILRNQTILKNKLGHPPLPGEGRLLVVCDDCLGAMNWNKDIWKRLASTFRHFGIDLLISTQSLTRLPYFMFDMATQGIVFRMDVFRGVQLVWERWLSAFDCGDDVKNPQQLMDYMKTKMPLNDHRFLKIDRNPKAKNNIELTRAPPKEEFEHFRIKFVKTR